MDEWSLFPLSNVFFSFFTLKSVVHCVHTQEISDAIMSQKNISVSFLV